jgi:lipid-binding SYLF domain-containing protein
VALARDGHGKWGDPVFIRFGGASIGVQTGAESTDIVLVFRTRKNLERVLNGTEKLTLGADAVVAAGPVGRDAPAATDPHPEAEVLSYARYRGLFAGVSLDGSVLHPEPEATAAFAKAADANEMKWAEQLKRKLAEMSARKVEAGPAPAPVFELPDPAWRPRIRPFGLHLRGVRWF